MERRKLCSFALSVISTEDWVADRLQRRNRRSPSAYEKGHRRKRRQRGLSRIFLPWKAIIITGRTTSPDEPARRLESKYAGTPLRDICSDPLEFSLVQTQYDLFYILIVKGLPYIQSRHCLQAIPVPGSSEWPKGRRPSIPPLLANPITPILTRPSPAILSFFKLTANTLGRKVGF